MLNVIMLSAMQPVEHLSRVLALISNIRPGFIGINALAYFVSTSVKIKPFFNIDTGSNFDGLDLDRGLFC